MNTWQAISTVAKAMPNADGTLSVTADADGTIEQPGLKATLKLANATVEGKAIGQFAADVHSEASTLLYTLTSDLIGAKVNASGQTMLSGNFETQAKLTLAGLDVGKAKLVVLKTGSNFLYFSKYRSRLIRADSPGETQSDLTAFTWKHITQPIYPFDKSFDWKP